MLQSPKTATLNAGQQAAADGFFEFLFSNEKEMIISGAGGYGKTFLMGHMIDEILPMYHNACKLAGISARYDEVVMSATTNKAAEVLSLSTGRNAGTVHSFMNLKVKDDYSTGRSTITKTNAWKIYNGKIIFIDECSMIDRALHNILLEGTVDCKIVYVGDKYQLAPVMESLSPIYLKDLRYYELTEPMRNSGQPALIDVCQQLRETVGTGVFKPIKVVPGVIDFLSGSEMQAEVDKYFIDEDVDARILAYTNRQVLDYNVYIRQLRGLPASFTEGERLVNNNAIRFGKGMLRVEQEVTILNQSEIETADILGDTKLDFRYTTLETSLGEVIAGVKVPVDMDYFTRLCKYFGQQRNFERYFFLKNNFPDLRQRDAQTVHKSQGSSYDTTFIDLANLSTCHNADTAARLLYVGFTRSRNRVVLYGTLAEKYGGILLP